MANFKPPKIARRFLHWHCDPELLEEIEGDLNEEFDAIHTAKGTRAARFFYLLEVLRFVRMYKPRKRIRSLNQIDMLFNNLKMAFRNLKKHKAYTSINFIGLVIGISCSFLIFLYVKAETSFDQFHEKAESIYRLQHVYGYMNAPIGRAFQAEYPEVKEVVRVYPWMEESRITLADNQQFYDDAFLADQNFFEIFSFKFISGNPQTALDNPNKIVLTEALAEKYFPDQDAVGQTLRFQALKGWTTETLELMVSAVIEDIPFNSHLQFEMLLPFEILQNDPEVTILDSWINDWIASYLVIEDGADIQKLETHAYNSLWKKHAGIDPLDPLRLMRLDRLYLNSGYLQADYAIIGDINQVRIFGAIAVVILLIACINFMNLATARASKRGKEVGVRKVMGAYKRQLVRQFLTESFLITLISALASCLLIYMAIPFLENLSGISLMGLFDNWIGIVLPFIGIVVVTALLAGAYPAFVLSAYEPSAVLRAAKNSAKSSGTLRKGLVVFQFSISVILILGAVVAYNQMSFVKNKSLGFKPEQVVAMTYGTTQELRERWNFIKGELAQIPAINQVFSTRMIPGDKAFSWGYKFEGYTEKPIGESWMGYYLGPNTIEGFGLEMLMGRGFSDEVSSDSNAWILNESALKLAIQKYGDEWKDPIGKRIEYYTTNSGSWNMDKSGTVIGVVKDFHHHSLQKPIEPLVIHNAHSKIVVVRIDEGELQSTLTLLESKWESFGSTNPFNYKLLDQEFNNQYAQEDRFTELMLIFCGLAIFVACLGLLGLASFTAELRIKEIGIRKVLGASIAQVLWLLSSNFLKLIALSVLLAAPLGYLLMNAWLSNFSYRIDVSWQYFIYATISTILIAAITVGYHSTKAATDNPTKSLRYE